MEIKLQDMFTKEITRLIGFSKNFKYEKCSEVSNFLAYYSLAFQSKILLFLSEFLIFLFDNMSITNILEEDDKKKEEVNKQIVKFLNELKKIDISIDENKEKIIDLMIEIRYIVSQFQVDVGSMDKSSSLSIFK